MSFQWHYILDLSYVGEVKFSNYKRGQDPRVPGG